MRVALCNSQVQVGLHLKVVFVEIDLHKVTQDRIHAIAQLVDFLDELCFLYRFQSMIP